MARKNVISCVIGFRVFFWIGLLLIVFILIKCTAPNGMKKGKFSAISEPVIPKEVVAPNGYKIFYIFNKDKPIDFNRDGLNDFVFKMGKDNVNNGDTSYLVFYKMNKDSSFSFFKQYDNVLPAFFLFY